MKRPEPARAVESLWYGRPTPHPLLRPLSFLYGAITGARRAAYERGWLRTVTLPVPVIVVGNITVGGTGKTPVVDWLVQLLRAEGWQPGIVSRGHGGRVRAPRLVQPEDAASEVGDEPLLLRRRGGVPVCVCPDRVAAARHLVRTEDVDVILADDGLQHYRLGRDLEIAVVDAERRQGNGSLLPAGPLREPARRLATVDLVLVNGGSAAGEAGFALQSTEAMSLADGARRPLQDFAGTRARMVAGIGNPGRFRRSLEAAGIMVEDVPVPDHGRVDLDELFLQSAVPVMMTEKDAVKYSAPTHGSIPGPVWVVPATLVPTGDTLERVRACLRSVPRPPSGSNGAERP